MSLEQDNDCTEQERTCPKCGHDNGWDFDVCEECGYGEIEES